MRHLFYFFTPAYDYATQCETWFVVEEMRGNDYIGAAPHFSFGVRSSLHIRYKDVAPYSLDFRLPSAVRSFSLGTIRTPENRFAICITPL